MRKELQEKLNALIESLAATGSLLVSYSGGVDSTLLSILARRVLGDRARCALLISPLLSEAMLQEAQETVCSYGLSCETIPFPALGNSMLASNPPDRCARCKHQMASLLHAKARELGLAHVADGVNCSDLLEYRPGIQAATKEGILHPFVEAGITKEEIRELARELGFLFWNHPSSACLASRIPYGTPLTREALQMVGETEAFLHTLGLEKVRVRLEGTLARIEVEASAMHRILEARNSILEFFHRQGCTYVTLDLQGYRSGSMDEVLRGDAP